MSNNELIEVQNYSTVKIDNHFNKVVLESWQQLEMNVFFTILSKMKNKGLETIIINTDVLKEESHYSKTSQDEWKEIIFKAVERVGILKYYEKTEKKLKMLSLFEIFEADLEKKTLTVKTSANWEYILNKFEDGNYTTFPLIDFINIKSVYVKSLFRLLMQWKYTGYKKIDAEEFRLYLDIPETYKQHNIKERILNRAEKELSPYLPNLLCSVIRNPKQKGRPVTHYIFQWTPLERTAFDSDKYKKDVGVEEPIKIKKHKTVIKEGVEFYTHRFIEEEKDIIYFEHLKPRRTKGGELHYYLDGEGILYTCFLDKDKKPIKMQVDGREYKLNSKMQEIYEDYKIENMDYDETYELIGRNVSISYLRKKNVKENTISNIVNKIKFVQKVLKENDENSEDYIYLAKPTMPIYRKEPDYWMDLDENRSFADWAFRNIAAENLSNKLVRGFKEDYLTYNDLFKEFKYKYKIAKSEGKTVKLVEWNWQKDPDKTELYYIENQKKNEELNIKPTEQDLADEIF